MGLECLSYQENIPSPAAKLSVMDVFNLSAVLELIAVLVSLF